MKFLAMHITNQKLRFDTFTVGNLLNIFMEHGFWHKRKIDNFDLYSVFLAVATNIPQRLETGFVVQGHICAFKCHLYWHNMMAHSSHQISKVLLYILCF